mmetsp:Transcript_75073/g.104295  ORF Transcript_75073/g.104295 Transcript_75073/m.104295 type:complete len:223 (-) Transcript_75073:122-790(-)
MTPAWRVGGTSTRRVLRRGRGSRPSCSKEEASSGFLRAFMIWGRGAKRGSLRRRSHVTTAGVRTRTVSRPPSTSRVTSRAAAAASCSTREAKVATGQASRPASSWPVWLQSSSIACLPSSTTSACCAVATCCSALATSSGCRASSPPSAVSTCTARSAPIASAVRSVSWHFLGPTDTTTTSEATLRSLRRMPSSTAISSNGFMLILAASTPSRSARTRTFTE